MYPICISHTYPACISITSEDCHVSCMYPACLNMYLTCSHHVSHMYLVCTCIPHVSGLPLQIHVSLMYPACILHLRYVPPWIHLGYIRKVRNYVSYSMYLVCISHVSHMYRDFVSWCILVYLDARRWHRFILPDHRYTIDTYSACSILLCNNEKRLGNLVSWYRRAITRLRFTKHERS